MLYANIFHLHLTTFTSETKKLIWDRSGVLSVDLASEYLCMNIDLYLQGHRLIKHF